MDELQFLPFIYNLLDILAYTGLGYVLLLSIYWLSDHIYRSIAFVFFLGPLAFGGLLFTIFALFIVVAVGVLGTGAVVFYNSIGIFSYHAGLILLTGGLFYNIIDSFSPKYEMTMTKRRIKLTVTTLGYIILLGIYITSLNLPAGPITAFLY